MNIWVICGQVSFLILILFFLFFTLFNLLEKEKKAFIRSILILSLLIVINSGFYMAVLPLKNLLFGSTGFLFLVIFFILIISPRPKSQIQIIGLQKRIDERDAIFSRFDLKEGTKRFIEYYRQKPHFKKIDEEIRKFPDILSPTHIKKNPWLFSLSAAEFDFLEYQLSQVDGKINAKSRKLSPQENTRMVKGLMKYLGADLCGICELDEAYVYSNVGRGPEVYGEEINLSHRYGIVFAVEMDFSLVASAPDTPVIVETAKKYVEAARISITMANCISRLGHTARAHIAGSNYQAILPPLAWKAGLGELGRMGTLISWKYGPRVRLGLITTNLPILPDKPICFGVQDFCEKCLKCAHCCPSNAIPAGPKTEENGVLKWVLKREECYRFWRRVGTDCAICMYVCPYSKPDNIFHNVIRKMTSRSSAIQTLSVWSDDFFYGRRPKPRKSCLEF